MVVNFRFLFIVVLLFHLVLPVFSFEPSGGVLVLDGDDDYAILPFAEHGYLIPANTFDFTAEVWFYPIDLTGTFHRWYTIGCKRVFNILDICNCPFLCKLRPELPHFVRNLTLEAGDRMARKLLICVNGYQPSVVGSQWRCRFVTVRLARECSKVKEMITEKPLY